MVSRKFRMTAGSRRFVIDNVPSEALPSEWLLSWTSHWKHQRLSNVSLESNIIIITSYSPTGTMPKTSMSLSNYSIDSLARELKSKLWSNHENQTRVLLTYFNLIVTCFRSLPTVGHPRGMTSSTRLSTAGSSGFCGDLTFTNRGQTGWPSQPRATLCLPPSWIALSPMSDHPHQIPVFWHVVFNLNL